MGRGLSKQQTAIIELLKKRGETEPKWPWLSTRKIVMTLHPEVEDYLIEKRRWGKFARRNAFSMPHDQFHEMYLKHEEMLKALPNYHTARTSVNRTLRGLVKRGLVVRQPYWGMYQKQGVSAGWLLPEYMSDNLKASPEFLKLLHEAYMS